MDQIGSNLGLALFVVKDVAAGGDIVKLARNVLMLDVVLRSVPNILGSIGRLHRHLLKRGNKRTSIELLRSVAPVGATPAGVKTSAAANQMYDDIMNALCKRNVRIPLKFTTSNFFVLDCWHPVKLDDDIFVKQHIVATDEEGHVTSAKIEVFSKSLAVNALQLRINTFLTSGPSDYVNVFKSR